MVYKVNVVFTKDEHGFYVFCPELKGCHSQGETFEEASVNIREALDLYIETMSREELDAVSTNIFL
jgi:predicted RNase H-like HicB family nuclease